MQDEITVTLEPEDIGEAYKPPPRKTRLRTLVLSLALCLAILILALLIRFPEAWPVLRDDPLIVGLMGAVCLAAFLVLVLLTTAPWLRGYVGRRTLRDHPGLSDPISYSFGPNEFRVRATYTEAHYPWNLLWDWRETSRVVIVLPTPQNFYVIPKRGVDAAVLGRLRERLNQARKCKPGR